jgi:hypothetical protein
MALAAVGALGFAAGRYLTGDASPPSLELTFPVVAPSDRASFGPAATVAASPRQVPGTLHAIMKLHGDFAQSTALYVLAASRDRKGIEQLLEEAESIGRGSERRAAASILYQRYAELDPAAAVDHMMSREAGFDPNELYSIFYSWARTDLDSALARAAKLDDRNRQMAGTAIVRSRDDLPASEREALGSKLNIHVAVRDSSAIDLRTPKAAERAWQTALAMANRDARQSELFRITHDWARQDPHAAIRAIESLQERGHREQLLQLAVQSWGQKNPREAIEWVLARPPSHRRTELLGSALGSLVRNEPATAMAMVERLSRVERQQVMPQLLFSWAQSDPQSAAAWLAKQDDGQTYPHALMMIASSYAERDPGQALQWAATLSGENSQVVMSQVIQRIAHDDPERAGSMITQLDDGPHREGAIAAIAQVWAQWDPRAALAWVAKQSTSDVTSNVYGAVFGQWAVYDVEAAVSQLNFILDTDTRNAAIHGVLGSGHLEPDLLDTLYLRLEGAEARRHAAAQIYHRLRENDPQAAERYRIEAGIGDERNDGTIIVN